MQKLDAEALFKCKGESRMVVPDGISTKLIKAKNRVAKLEKLFADEIKKVADLLKENQALEKRLEETQKQRDCWRKLYRKIKPDEKVNCNRQQAMVEHGEINISEVLGRENSRREDRE